MSAIRDYVQQPFGTFTGLFALQVAADPEKTAVLCGDAGISYRELDARADRIAAALEEAGVSLYAQHVDPLDTATLVDIFRAEEESCLLGTDAVRDGVDVPGRSLRLLVADRVPWPRPDILHRARRLAFGGSHYDDAIVRLRLRQAFGRLIRAREDRGVFVLLDGALPTRLTTAFPEGVTVERVGIAEAIRRTRAFLHPQAGQDRDRRDGAGLPLPEASGNNRGPAVPGARKPGDRQHDNRRPDDISG